MILVLDAMALIHLAKSTVLESVCKRFEVVIPSEVFEEAVRKSLGAYADAALSSELVEKKLIRVENVAEKTKAAVARFGLAGGEAGCAALALELSKKGKNSVLVSNDKAVKNAAGLLGFTWTYVPMLLVVLGRRGQLPKEKARRALLLLETLGWYSKRVIDDALEVL